MNKMVKGADNLFLEGKGRWIFNEAISIIALALILHVLSTVSSTFHPFQLQRMT